MFKMPQQTAHMLLLVTLNVSPVHYQHQRWLHLWPLVTYTLLLWSTVIHMPHKRNLMGSSQVTTWAKPPLRLLISNFLLWFFWKIPLPLCWNVQVHHHVARSTFPKYSSNSLREKFPCPSITCGLIRLLILCTTVLTMTLHVWIFLSTGVQISGSHNTIPRNTMSERTCSHTCGCSQNHAWLTLH
jgi:hypothetical protein